MLDFVIFAVTFVTGLLIFVFYLYPGSRKTGTTIPGMQPSDAKDGNLADIVSAGSLHEFLAKLHSEYGPIASFWMGTQIVVSLASPELFEQHRHIFDRPVELFEGFRWLLGDNSIFFANGSQGRIRHEKFTEHFVKLSRDENMCLKIKKLAEELVEQLLILPKDQHIPLGQCMTAMSMKVLSLAILGDGFADDLQFLSQFETLHAAMESKLVPQSVTPDAVEKEISSALKKVKSAVEVALKTVKFPASNQTAIDDCITVIQQGYHTIGNLLTWVMYYVSAHRDIQDKVYAEVSHVTKAGITAETINTLSYTKQVIEESLRLSALVSYTARSQDQTVEVGGHLIPKGTPVIHSLGVVTRDSQVWTLPDNFDPERFSPEVERHQLGFTPWGFAGKRQCPGKSLAMTTVMVAMAVILDSLAFELADDQVVFKSYGLSTKPQDEIWVTVSKRK